ncbi:hypothetical protein [Haloferula sp. A504]|uniref:hypothetical protein n=1 Tax=Haloferula sp. A504 TaxID=3373601 RepID=UPI0031CA1253|nr:hypothetical protein [Verrucomicrobiaceae bacterium E54]
MRFSIRIILVVSLGIHLPGCSKETQSSEAQLGTDTSPRVVGLGNIVAIPHRLVRDDGAYQMVSIIDGVAANHRFMAAVRFVREQGERLVKEDGKGEPEGGEAKEGVPTQETYRRNQEILLETYGFKPGGDHLMMPVRSTLYEVSDAGSGEGAEVTRSKVMELDSIEAYELLQKLREDYARLSAEAGGEGKATEVAERLRSGFGFDVTRKYELEVSKTVLFQKVDGS